MIDILIKTNSPFITIKYCQNNKINIYNIKHQKDSIILKINKKDYKKINNIYKAKIIKVYGFQNFNSFIINNKKNVTNLILIILLIITMTKINIGIIINTENKTLRKLLLNELDKNNIDKYKLIKSPKELNKIKNNILSQNKNEIEWLNIERKGMNYIIDISPRIEKNKYNPSNHCNIISKKDSLITKMVTFKGVEMVDVNDLVKENDLLISGDIIYNEETKKQVCAEGQVYGTTWYTINIKIPKTYQEINKTNLKRYNILLKYNNKEHKLFKSRINNFIKENKRLIKIFGLEIILSKEIKVNYKEKVYSEDQLNNLINKKIEESISHLTKNNFIIKETKILNKYENKKNLETEIFVVVEELISKQIVLE